MESYIIRIYRRNQEDGEGLVGLVEFVDTDDRRSFRSSDELWAILLGAGKRIKKNQRSKGDTEWQEVKKWDIWNTSR